MITHISRAVSLFLAAAAAWAVIPPVPVAAQPPAASPVVQVQDEPIKGVIVRTKGAKDLSSGQVATADSLKGELEDAVTAAVQSGLNAIFFEARPDAQLLYQSQILPQIPLYKNYSEIGKFDALEYLVEKAAGQGIAVYAVMSPYLLADKDKAADLQASANYKAYQDISLPASDGSLIINPANKNGMELIAKAGAELLNRYPIAGLVFDSLFQDSVLQLQKNRNFAAELMSLIRGSSDSGKGQKLGIAIPASNENMAQYLLAENLQELGATDFVTSYVDSSSAYLDSAANIRAKAGSANVITLNTLSANGKNPDAAALIGNNRDLSYQVTANSINGMGGFVIDSYSSLRRNQNTIAQEVNADYSEILAYLDSSGLDFPQELSVNRPSGDLQTWYQQYFIMGTSDPSLPLLMDGKEVERYGTKGAFGILVNLAAGKNTFTFTQGGAAETVVISRVTGSSQPSPISAITQSSMFPSADDVVFSDSSISLKCVAPAGSSVTASVAGQTVPLAQAAETAQAGIPATFSGKLPFPAEYDANGVFPVGPVTYTLTYGGKTTEYTSSGNLFLAGAGTPVKVKVKNYMANVLVNYKVPGDFVTALKIGAVDSIVPSEESYASSGDEFFALSSGGYISKRDVEILDGSPSVINQVSKAVLQETAQGEQLILTGTVSPVYHANQTEAGFSVELFQTGLDPTQISVAGSQLIQKIGVTQNQGSVTLDFTLKNPLWGYDVSFNGADTIIFIKRAPELSGSAAYPLKGVTVVLDPGHGGTDSGALGITGAEGPTESNLNDIVSQVTRMRLEQLGAEVQMTRTDDTFIGLDDRMIYTDGVLPDFFIAVHHNSTAENTDSNKAKGVEVYFHTPYSQAFSDNMLEAVSAATGRMKRQSMISYFRVVRTTYAPAVLLETGFVPNPAEYEQLCDPVVIMNTAEGICNGIINTIKQYHVSQ